MRKHLVRYLLGLAVLLLLLGHAARVLDLPFIDRLDAILYDTKLRLTLPGGTDERIVILDIDEKSLAEIGHWPWGRDKLAALLDKLFDRYHVALVGFDVVFAEPDGSSGLASLDALAGGELRGDRAFQSALGQLRPRLDYDARFAAAMKDRPVILGYYFSSLPESVGHGVLPRPVLSAGPSLTAPRSYSFGANLAPLQESAAGGGHFTPLPDFDGVTRRVPMLVEYQGQLYESLALAMVRALAGFPDVVPGYPEERFFSRKTYAGIEWLELPAAEGAVRIPVDADVATLIPYRGPQGSFPYLSIADVLAERVPAERLRDKIAVVGTTAAGLMDQRATPVSASYAGVEIHANLVAGMLDGRLRHRPAYAQGAEVVLLLLAGAVMVLWVPLLPPLRASAVAGGVLALLVTVNLVAWQAGHLVLPLAGGIVLVLVLYALHMSWGYFVESRSKRQITGLFGQYVPPELVDEMARDPGSYSMEGRRAELTVLFSDIRGFTSISEGMPPDQLTALMNEYLGAMTEVVRRYRGTLDKYMGDAIMAFWGAPVEDPQHAWHAVLCAVDMQAALVDLNRRLAARGWPELRIGIGINTGMMTVGDMGSTVRKAYTVMGDAVNLASRLEGLTKQYGVGIIVGEGTRAGLKGRYLFRELDRVRVQGKEEPVAISEPIAREGEAAARSEELSLWHQALRHYRARDWDQAELALMNLSRLAPAPLYELYACRVDHCRKMPPAEGWDGVWTFESK